MKAILEAAQEIDNNWFYAREIREKVSAKVGQSVSSHLIGNYLRDFTQRYIIEKEKVNSRLPYRYRLNEKLIKFKKIIH